MASNSSKKSAGVKTSVSKTAAAKKVISADSTNVINKSNKLTDKEIAARKLKKYATTTFGFNTKNAFSGGDVANAQGASFYSPQLSTDFLEKPQNLRERRAWYRHFYNSNEFVGRAIDLHTELPLSKIRLEKPHAQNEDQVDYIYSFYVDLCEDIKLFKTLTEISHEYNLFGNCVHKDSEIRTDKGYKKASEIEVGDWVLTSKERYRKVIKKCDRKIDELLSISCQNDFRYLMVTEEHPVEVCRDDKFSFIEASEVRDSDYIRITGNRLSEESVEDIPLTSCKVTLDEDVAYLIGYWFNKGVLEGNFINFNKTEISWSLFTDVHSVKVINNFRKTLHEKFNNEYTEVYSINFIEFKINDKIFLDWWGKNFGDTIDNHKKKIPGWIINLPKKVLESFLAGIADSMGYDFIKIKDLNKENVYLLRDIALKCGVVPNIKRANGNGSSKGKYDYTIDSNFSQITNRCFNEVVKRVYTKIPKRDDYLVKDDKVALKVKSLSKEKYDDVVYNFEVEEDHTYQVSGYSTHNCFIFAEDSNPYDIEGDDPDTINAKIEELKKYGKKRAEDLYNEFKIIDKDPNYKGWRKLLILPPDQVRLKKIPLSDESLIEYLPDPDTRKSLLSSSNDAIYSSTDIDQHRGQYKIPDKLVESLNQNGSIPLDTDPNSGSHAFHLARKKSQYETMGISMLERCVNTLLLQDKLRQAQTQIATRHMTPIRIVWADELSEPDVDNLREQVDLSLVDPDYSIITNYEVHWEEMGSNGRLLELSSEYDHIENSLFAGLGVTREILTGEGTYTGGRLTLEIMNTQYLLFREHIQEYVENNLFKPIARKKGFIEKDKYGREKLIYPKLSFTRLAIKDNDTFFDQAMQLYNKGSISIDVILEMLNVDPVSTRKKIEADLFTVNDFAFNQLMSNVYVTAASLLGERYNIGEKLADYLKLQELPQPEGEGEGEGGLGGDMGGGLGGLGGRFASEGMPKSMPKSMPKGMPKGMDKNSKEALDKLVAFALKNPDKLELLNKYMESSGNKE